jgi:hypothetical protein
VEETEDGETIYTSSSELENVNGNGIIDWDHAITVEEVLGDDDLLTSGEGIRNTQVLKDAGEILRQILVKRRKTMTITLNLSQPVTEGQEDKLGELILQYALEETENSWEGDYLHYHLGVTQWHTSWSNTTPLYRIRFEFQYYTTAAQEEYVTERVAQIIKSMNFNDTTTPYMKIWTIYKYICENVTYDYTHLYDDSYVLKYSAYAALKNGTAVCQGYSNLLYRMLREVGIETRCITGTSGSDSHIWNIIYLWGNYYNADPTWDSEDVETSLAYSFFLKSDEEFFSHTSDTQFTTTTFLSSHPKADASYSAGENDVQDCTHQWSEWMIDLEPTCQKEGERRRYCESCGEEEHKQIKKASHQWKYTSIGSTNLHKRTCSVCKISSTQKCTFVDHVCKNCKAVYIPEAVKSVKVKSYDSNKMKISWTEVSEADGYQVYRLEGSKWHCIGTVTGTSFIQTGSTQYPVKKGQTYSYKVRAICKGEGKTVTGDFSTVVKAKATK